jgi:wobble nucleotide-excising tRNase
LIWTGGVRLDFLVVEQLALRAKIFVAILLIAAVPAYAQAQTRNAPKVTKGDAQKVLKIIRSDKAKIQTYCEINKVSDQMNEAYGKNDKKTVDELSQKIERLEKILGPEYVALMDGLQKLGPENSKRAAQILLQFAALDRLCTT